MDQDIPNNFDKEEQDDHEARATVEGEEGAEGGEQHPQESSEGTPEEGASPNNEGEQQQDESASLANQNLSSDLPAGLTDKIDEMTKNQGAGADGKPIEINETELNKLMTSNANGNEEGEN